MEQFWQETKSLLDLIDQEYNAILQELDTATNSQRVKYLRAMAAARVAEFQATVWRYRVAKRIETVS